MGHEIKNCPLTAILKGGGMILFNSDVTVEGNVVFSLTAESVAKISTELYMKGLDVLSVNIDEARIDYIGIEVL